MVPLAVAEGADKGVVDVALTAVEEVIAGIPPVRVGSGEETEEDMRMIIRKRKIVKAMRHIRDKLRGWNSKRNPGYDKQSDNDRKNDVMDDRDDEGGKKRGDDTMQSDEEYKSSGWQRKMGE
jgi:hypothetical protein